MRLFLHVGLPKTGTSSIQTWIARHSDALHGHGVQTFPTTILGHRLAVETIVDEKRLGLADIVYIKKTPFKEVQQALQKLQARAGKDDQMLISSEYFSESDLPRLSTVLRELGCPEPSIIVLLRRQDRFIESNYNQAIKAMGRHQPLGEPEYSPRHDWSLLLSRWTSVFGRDRVIPLNFDRIVSSKKSLLTAFLEVVDPAIAEKMPNELAQEPTRNLSLPAALLEFQRLANTLGSINLAPLFKSAMKEGIGGPPFRMEPAKARAYLDIYREGNRQVAAEYFPTASGDLFDESDLDRETNGADFTGRLPVEAAASILAFYIRQNDERVGQLQQQIRAATAQLQK
jgi:hypothetical protein